MLLLGREIVETRDLVHAEIDLVAQRWQSRAVEMRPADDLAPALLLLLDADAQGLDGDQLAADLGVEMAWR